MCIFYDKPRFCSDILLEAQHTGIDASGYLSLIRPWLFEDKNSARYFTGFLTLQWPLSPQGHFQSQKALYLHTLVCSTGCACCQRPAVAQDINNPPKSDDNQLRPFKCNLIYFVVVPVKKKKAQIAVGSS